MPIDRSLDDQRREFTRRRLTAMPLAGVCAWTAVGIAGLLLPPSRAALVLFVATGTTVYLGMFFSRFTGEHMLDRTRPPNAFDALFFHTLAMALLVYAIAIPFFLQDSTSLPLTVGILTGIIWLPLSWTIGHWVGIFHATARTAGVLAAWYMFPTQRFVVVPAVIVLVYVVSIVVLEQRWRALLASGPS